MAKAITVREGNIFIDSTKNFDKDRVLLNEMLAKAESLIKKLENAKPAPQETGGQGDSGEQPVTGNTVSAGSHVYRVDGTLNMASALSSYVLESFNEGDVFYFLGDPGGKVDYVGKDGIKELDVVFGTVQLMILSAKQNGKLVLYPSDAFVGYSGGKWSFYPCEAPPVY